MFTTLQIRCKNGCVYVKENEDATSEEAAQYCFEASTGGKTSCKGVDGASCTSSEQQGFLLFHTLWFLNCFEPHIYVLDIFEIVKVIIIPIHGKVMMIINKGGLEHAITAGTWRWLMLKKDGMRLFAALDSRAAVFQRNPIKERVLKGQPCHYQENWHWWKERWMYFD